MKKIIQKLKRLSIKFKFAVPLAAGAYWLGKYTIIIWNAALMVWDAAHQWLA